MSSHETFEGSTRHFSVYVDWTACMIRLVPRSEACAFSKHDKRVMQHVYCSGRSACRSAKIYIRRMNKENAV